MANVLNMTQAARRLGVKTTVLTSLRYRGLLDDIDLERLGNQTIVREDQLPALAAIIRAHTQLTPAVTAGPTQFA